MNVAEAVLNELATARHAIQELDGHIHEISMWATLLHERLADGHRLLAAGNGGSAAHVQHLTSELVGRFCHDRPPFSALSLAVEPSSVTAISNDYGYDEVFARQVDAHARPGDVFLAISTSGASSNLLAASSRAERAGLLRLALTGPGPNPLAMATDRWIGTVGQSTAAIQAAHQVVIHALCAAFDTLLGVSGTKGATQWSTSR